MGCCQADILVNEVFSPERECYRRARPLSRRRLPLSSGDQHQFMTKIIREPRLVMRMSDPLLAVLEAAGVAEGRTAAG